MTLAPAITATLGSLRYDTHAIALAVELAPLPRGGSARLTLPPAVRCDAQPGDDAVLSLDGGEGAEPVLTGEVLAVARHPDRIEVTIADAGAALARLRPCATFERQGAAAILRKLATDAGVGTGTLAIDLELPAYAAHPQRNAAEHVARLALWADAMALVDGSGKLVVRPRPEGPADHALRYGRELTSVRAHGAAPVNPQRYAIGNGPSGNAGAPDALRPAADPLPASAAAGGAGIRRLPLPALRTPGAVDRASTALSAEAARGAGALTLSAFLLPHLRPGQVLEVQDLPAGFPDGTYLVTHVRHRHDRRGGASEVDAELLAAPSLLGALVGAVGALL